MTLVEVLVATVLLGVGVAGLMSVASLAVRNQHQSEQRTSAVWLAQEKLSEVAEVGPNIWLNSRPMQGSQTQNDAVYEWTLQIESAGLIGELYMVGIDVQWTSAAGRAGAVGFETWLNDYEAAALIPKDQREQASPTTPGAPLGG